MHRHFKIIIFFYPHTENRIAFLQFNCEFISVCQTDIKRCWSNRLSNFSVVQIIKDKISNLFSFQLRALLINRQSGSTMYESLVNIEEFVSLFSTVMRSLKTHLFVWLAKFKTNVFLVLVNSKRILYGLNASFIYAFY